MTLEELHKKCLECKKCKLRAGATQVVPGHGNPNAEIMFVGEGPGKNEDEQGVPFCGAAGKLLDEMLASIGLEREDVFIGNMIKCRPPNNRDPMEDELEACEPWLDQQMKLIQPKVVVTLGRFSMAKMLPGSKISDVHGKVFEREWYVVIPLYHPAVGLYKYAMRQTLMQDFKSIKQFLDGELEPESFASAVDDVKALLKMSKAQPKKPSQATMF